MSEPKIYRMEEVKKHNHIKSTWMVIHNVVYDVTEVYDEHPGGNELILEYAGREATKAFDDSHSSHTKKMIAKYKIGVLAEEDQVHSVSKKTEKSSKIWINDDDKLSAECDMKFWFTSILLVLVLFAAIGGILYYFLK